MGVSLVSVVEVYDTEAKAWKPEFKELAVNPAHRSWGPFNGEHYEMDPHCIVLAEKRHPGKKRDEMDTDELFGPYHINQDCRVFAVLADVRNDEGDRPISPPRGLPVDKSMETFTLWVQNKADAFAMSYLTVDELQAYDWDRSCLWWDWRNNKTKTTPMREAETFQRLLMVIGRMAELGEPDKVRIVFWFMP